MYLPTDTRRTAASQRPQRVLSVFGTRPEAIKMAPLVKRLQATPGIETRVCVTAQHRQMLDQVMALFGLSANHDMAVMQPNQTLNGLFARVMAGADAILEYIVPIIVPGNWRGIGKGRG